MYLKSLKLKGFKSFAETSEIDLSPGICAIVGPNGSGKCNIIDAMRWVLGEQRSKSLRGKKMEDVIFAGTEDKAPLGYAEVIMTLDNADGYLADAPDEVSVSRRLFRSGESDYRINGQNCRLKDIQALFTDTGLGKNGYSIISQGQIENIVNANPSELRNIVEEAVGIVSTKNKKIEAEKKLAVTEDNMDRIWDILQEMNRRHAPLKKQAEKAKTYLALRDELKAVDLSVFSEDIAAIEKELTEVQRKTDMQVMNVGVTEKRLADKDKAYTTLKAQGRNSEEKRAELDGKIEQLTQTLTAQKSESLVIKERISGQDRELERLQGDIAEQRKVCLQSENTLGEAKGKADELTARLREKNEKIDALKTKENDTAQKLRSLRERAHKRSETAESETARKQELLEKISQVSAEEAAKSAALSLRSAKTAEDQNKRDGFDGNLTRLNQEIDALTKSVTDLEAEAQKADAARRDAQNKAEAGRQAVDKLANDIRVLSSQKDYLENIQRHYDDYYPAVKAVMAEGALPETVRQNIFGPIGELIDIPPKFVKAIDTALGARSQNIVCADTRTAGQAIDMLKRTRRGRATFLPMDNLRYQRISREEEHVFLSENGVLGIASDVIDVEPRFKRVVDSLLGKTVVTADFAAAKAFRARRRGFTIVTLEGELFYPGGAIVGGETKGKRQSPLSKKQEIAALTETIEAKKAELSRVREACLRIEQNLADIKQKRRAGYTNLDEIRQVLLEKQRDARNVKLSLDSLNETIRNEKAQTDALTGERDVLRESIAAMKAEMEAIGESDIDQSKDSGIIEAVSRELSALREDIAELSIQAARLEESLHSAERDVERLKDSLSVHRGRLKRLTDEYDATVAQKNKLSAHLSAIGEQIEENNDKLETLTAEKKELSEASDDLSETLEALDRDIRNLNHELIVQNEAKTNLEIEKNRLIDKKDRIEEKLYNRYDMNVLMARDWLAEQHVEEKDLSRERQRELTAAIDELGHVNIQAVEEFAELDERYRFMQGQFDDLEQAKKEVESVIEDLYLSMSEQFKTGFDALADHFSRIFAILFEGGRAKLRYADPEHIMESGIELVAQPPGKNLRHISLLSGGEKSMTAIALLFSFLAVNPSPFCVIDEIDAALDDSNISRFTGYLKKIKSKSQFIIITHRKTTLTVCESVYGVSMAKSGISKLLSIRISDYTKDGDMGDISA